MDNAQKAIMIGVGLFIAIIIISAVLLITNMGSNLIKKSTTDLGTLTDDLANQIIKDYDGKQISGSEALAVINKYNISTDIAILFTNDTTVPVVATTVFARTGAKNIGVAGAVPITGTIGQTGVTAVSVNAVVKTPLSSFTDNTNAFYIVPGTYYKTSVVKNATSGAVVGIAIQKAV